MLFFKKKDPTKNNNAGIQKISKPQVLNLSYLIRDGYYVFQINNKSSASSRIILQCLKPNTDEWIEIKDIIIKDSIIRTSSLEIDCNDKVRYTIVDNTTNLPLFISNTITIESTPSIFNVTYKRTNNTLHFIISNMSNIECSHILQLRKKCINQWIDIDSFKNYSIIYTLPEDTEIGDEYRIITRTKYGDYSSNVFSIEYKPSFFDVTYERFYNTLHFEISNTLPTEYPHILQKRKIGNNQWIDIGSFSSSPFEYKLPKHTSIGDEYRIITKTSYKEYASNTFFIDRDYILLPLKINLNYTRNENNIEFQIEPSRKTNNEITLEKFNTTTNMWEKELSSLTQPIIHDINPTYGTVGLFRCSIFDDNNNETFHSNEVYISESYVLKTKIKLQTYRHLNSLYMYIKDDVYPSMRHYIQVRKYPSDEWKAIEFFIGNTYSYQLPGNTEIGDEYRCAVKNRYDEWINVSNSVSIEDIYYSKYDIYDFNNTKEENFEIFIANILRCNNYKNINLRRTEISSNEILIAEKEGIKFAFICLIPSNQIDVSDVYKAISIRKELNNIATILVSPRPFSESATNAANSENIYCWERKKIIDMFTE